MWKGCSRSAGTAGSRTPRSPAQSRSPAGVALPDPPASRAWISPRASSWARETRRADPMGDSSTPCPPTCTCSLAAENGCGRSLFPEDFRLSMYRRSLTRSAPPLSAHEVLRFVEALRGQAAERAEKLPCIGQQATALQSSTTPCAAAISAISGWRPSASHAGVVHRDDGPRAASVRPSSRLRPG